MCGKKKKKNEVVESVELNDDQLDAVSGGLIAQDPNGKWRVVTKEGRLYDGEYKYKSSAKAMAGELWRSKREISWDDVMRRQKENNIHYAEWPH